MLEIVVNPDLTVKIPLVGSFYRYRGEVVEIISTRTFQTERRGSFIPDFSTIADILYVSEEGDDLGKDLESVNADELTEI